jgi:hypothetical protein
MVRIRVYEFLPNRLEQMVARLERQENVTLPKAGYD